MIENLCGDLIEAVESFLNLSTITIDGVQYVPITDVVVASFDLFARAFARVELLVSASIFGFALTICSAHFLCCYFRSYRKVKDKQQDKT